MEFYQEKQNRLETREEGAIQISIEHALNDDESGGRLTLTIIDSSKGFEDYKLSHTHMLHLMSPFCGFGIYLVVIKLFDACNLLKYKHIFFTV